MEAKSWKNEFEVGMLASWADVMYKDHHSLQKQVQFNMSKVHANDVLVGAVFEFKKQDCRKAAIQFFKEKLMVDVTSDDVLQGHRTGSRRVI